MPGRVVAIMADAGAAVARGAALMVIEAMKMEHTIAAPADGHVESFRYSPGDQVDEGAELMTFIAEEDV
jgi:3-methylcrotonyl-CoA carboxylase alpha subunit